MMRNMMRQLAYDRLYCTRFLLENSVDKCFLAAPWRMTVLHFCRSARTWEWARRWFARSSRHILNISPWSLTWWSWRIQGGRTPWLVSWLNNFGVLRSLLALQFSAFMGGFLGFFWFKQTRLGLVTELVKPEMQRDEINPGRALECIWSAAHFAIKATPREVKKVFEKVSQTILRSTQKVPRGYLPGDFWASFGFTERPFMEFFFKSVAS